jgi:tRNA threonylcarbamoyl adenosine modification protein YeaZ
MVLVIDTSSACSAVAVLDHTWRPVEESVKPGGREYDLDREVRAIVEPRAITRVAAATGPGSFTGVRIGVAYALGLAIARGIPIHPLGSLELASKRAREPATGVTEAGRGRVYYQVPGHEPRVGEPPEIPADHPLSGCLREATADALRSAGLRLLEPAQLRSFGEAAAELIEVAPEAGYDSLRLEYVQSFGPLGPRKF